MVRSRDKGAAAEREVARILREHGFDGARRGQQFCGADGSADVVGLPGVHIECKRTEALRLWDALAQAKSDAREGEVPVVAHRPSRRPWVVILSLEDFLGLYGRAERGGRMGDG
jgi:Holliday junction resolvase